jgi:hypothetical protein
MKAIWGKYLAVLVMALVSAGLAFGAESKRGFYQGNLTGGGKIVFFVQGNHAISAYFFDVAGQQTGFAGGGAGNDGSFSLKTNKQVTISGTITDAQITATYEGQQITAPRVSAFGPTEEIAGRYSAPAHSSAGNIETKLLIDAQGNVFLSGKHGQTTIGGFGTITIISNATPTPSPSATPTGTPSATPTGTPSATATGTPTATATASASATASATASPTATPTGTPSATPTASPGDDDEDDDDDQDHNEDGNSATIHATFTVTLITGETITGDLRFNHGVVFGTFTWNGAVYEIRAMQESAGNRLANIATRGFVNTGQGELIGGFIITGGPKMVLIRAMGPSLTAQGVSPVLADPKLQLFENDTLLKENNDWETNSNSADILATTIPPTNPKEAAVLVRLEPGYYTTVVNGADGGTGIALVEVYEIDID